VRAFYAARATVALVDARADSTDRAKQLIYVCARRSVVSDPTEIFLRE
jgi:hypothetical protein